MPLSTGAYVYIRYNFTIHQYLQFAATFYNIFVCANGMIRHEDTYNVRLLVSVKSEILSWALIIFNNVTV